MGWLVPVTIVAGSLLAAVLPVVVTFPLLPPFGLLMLLAWRLHRADALRVWSAAPLGFVDDLMSGQPIGSATFCWAMCLIAIDVLDTRLVSRDIWQDWLLASGGIGFTLLASRLFATPLDAHVDTALLLQIGVAAALFPLATRLCAAIERREAKR